MTPDTAVNFSKMLGSLSIVATRGLTAPQAREFDARYQLIFTDSMELTDKEFDAKYLESLFPAPK